VPFISALWEPIIIAAQSSKGRGPAANNGLFVAREPWNGKPLKQTKSKGSTIVLEVSHSLAGLEGRKIALDHVKRGFYSA
jgi:hypothetical protein